MPLLSHFLDFSRLNVPLSDCIPLPNLRFPDFTKYSHAWLNLASHKQHLTFGLNRTAELLAADKPLYFKESDYLLDTALYGPEKQFYTIVSLCTTVAIYLGHVNGYASRTHNMDTLNGYTYWTLLRNFYSILHWCFSYGHTLCTYYFVSY